jgi:hypothetical protein
VKHTGQHRLCLSNLYRNMRSTTRNFHRLSLWKLSHCEIGAVSGEEATMKFNLTLAKGSTAHAVSVHRLVLSVGLQGSCILILDPDRFDLTVGGRRRLFSWTRTTLQLLLNIITYSRFLFSCRLPFKVYHWLFNSWECPHLFILRSLVRIQSFILILSLLILFMQPIVISSVFAL